jgi:UDP-N-acetylmuramoylalanine--D-glutamate ligase
MRNQEYFLGKKVLVVGFARSGLSAANLLYSLKAQVSITEKQDNPCLRNNLKELKSTDIKVELGRHSREFLDGIELVVISPGVPNEAFPVVLAKELGIPIISEIELAWILCSGKVVAITGTNGKTTVTTLTGKIIEAWGKKVYVCGNIGRPFTSVVENIDKEDFVSLEVSSFQLEHIDKFKPFISVLLNLSRNHLDRYSGMRDYLSAKERIFMNQDSSDFLVLNSEDSDICALGTNVKPRVLYFKKEEGFNPNQSAVLTISSILGVDENLVLKVFKDFKGVEHRMEEVADIEGVKFINDSKSTTTEATVWALNNLSVPIILIAGGREKGNDYGRVIDLARGKIKALILIGEAKEKLRLAFGNSFSIKDTSTLDEAVYKAYSVASVGDCILFSPMCKSFDMFSNYEERGRIFKEIVHKIKEGLRTRP